MTTVLLNGRKLPHQDWEGDDFTPGAGGKYVTCTDTSTGRCLYYASNGRINLDGRQIRAAVHPHDPNGITLIQAKKAVEALTNTTLIVPSNWDWFDFLTHARLKKGAVIQVWYSKIPRDYRFQLAANFGHAMFISHYSPTAGFRTWDALDANKTHHGSWVPARYIRASMEELSRRMGVTSLYVGYVPLQPLRAA
jgi:hypothetical protein